MVRGGLSRKGAVVVRCSLGSGSFCCIPDNVQGQDCRNVYGGAGSRQVEGDKM